MSSPDDAKPTDAVHINATGDVAIGQDVVGRDKYVIHNPVIVQESAAPPLTPEARRAQTTCGTITIILMVVVMLIAVGGMAAMYFGVITPVMQQFCTNWGAAPNSPPWCVP